MQKEIADTIKSLTQEEREQVLKEIKIICEGRNRKVGEKS